MDVERVQQTPYSIEHRRSSTVHDAFSHWYLFISSSFKPVKWAKFSFSVMLVGLCNIYPLTWWLVSAVFWRCLWFISTQYSSFSLSVVTSRSPPSSSSFSPLSHRSCASFISANSFCISTSLSSNYQERSKRACLWCMYLSMKTTTDWRTNCPCSQVMAY